MLTTVSNTPGPRKLYTDDDMAQLGLQQVSIKTVKGWFTEAFGGISGTGTNNNGWENTKTLKFGDLTPDEAQFISLKGRPDASDQSIKGKVISSDRQGNIHKSLYIYDGTAAIELKLYNGLYLDYLLDLDNMKSQWVYVRLDGLYLGNYRMMLSIGGAPSDGINTAGTHKYYANSNLDNPRVAKLNVFAGEIRAAGSLGHPRGGRFELHLAGRGSVGASGAVQGDQGPLCGLSESGRGDQSASQKRHLVQFERESLSELDRDRLGDAPFRCVVPLGL